MEPFHIHRDSHRFSLKSGFTLIELMVVFVIITTITTVAITSQSTFNKTLILANTAYDIALTLRSAQSFGIGSRATTLGLANAGYGLHFDTGSRGSFILFADTSPAVPDSSCTRPDCKPGDHVYTAPPADTLIGQPYQINNGITVSNLCAYSSSWHCALSSLDIVFARPNPDAFINAGGFSYTAACLTIASPSAPNGPYRYVSVAASGAITVSASPCP